MDGYVLHSSLVLISQHNIAIDHWLRYQPHSYSFKNQAAGSHALPHRINPAVSFTLTHNHIHSPLRKIISRPKLACEVHHSCSDTCILGGSDIYIGQPIVISRLTRTINSN